MKRKFVRKEEKVKPVKNIPLPLPEAWVYGINWGDSDDLAVAREEYRKRKKKGKKLRRYAFEDESEYKTVWLSKRLRDPNNPKQLKYWGVELAENRPPKRKLANGDLSPEDWIYNPPDPRDPVNEISPKRVWLVRTLRRVLGFPRVITVARSGEAPVDWKAHLLASELGGKEMTRRMHFSSYEKDYVKTTWKPSKVKRIGNKKLPYMFICSRGIWYFSTKADALLGAKKVLSHPDIVAKQGILRRRNRRWTVKKKGSKYKLFKSKG